ncbi:MAG: hypothetical protein QGI45_10290 [Myxococcota bacterium]|jgi:hypothetical protein|nr:hypothetical protein [Myxococcota bacterium]
MRKTIFFAIACSVLHWFLPNTAHAENEAPQLNENAGIYQYLLNQFSGPENESHVYGVIESNLYKTNGSPAGISDAGDTTYSSDPHQFGLPHAHLMLQTSKGDLFNGFLNLNIDDSETIAVKNAWFEIGLSGEMLKLRLGKFYRPFGLFNEVRDSVTSRLSIELPEYLDSHHPIISPTTNVMLHGRINTSGHVLRYAMTTGNDLRAGSQSPFGLDMYYAYNNFLRIGGSYYTSSGNAVAPNDTIGELKESPVQNWMEKDKFNAYGAYMRLKHIGFLLEVEYWGSDHKGQRDVEQIQSLESLAYLNPTQLQRFGLDGIPTTTNDNIPLKANYKVTSYLMRLAYTWETEFGLVTPYITYDRYKNPETIAEIEYGGDSKSGRSEDGGFEKFSFGMILKPIPAIAVKAGYCNNRVKFNNQSVLFSSYILSAAYFWELN